MMAGMQEVATLQRGMQIEEFKLFRNYREASDLRLASRRHVQEAYSKEYDAMEVLVRLRSEEKEAELIHEETQDMASRANQFEQRASNRSYASTADRMGYVASKLKGTSIEKQAEEEAAEASVRLVHAEELEREGLTRLHNAEAILNGTTVDSDTISEIVASNKGICRWMSWACKGVDKSAPMDPNKKVSNEAISLANEFSESLKLIDQAKKERENAVELLHRSSEDVNTSIALLERAYDLREKADREHSDAIELYQKAKAVEEQTEKDEMMGALEDQEVVMDKIRLIEDLNLMSEFAVEAREEAQNATALEFNSKDEQGRVIETGLRIRQATFAAKRHVTHAGWIALFAVLFSVVLLVLAALRVANAFQNNEPFSWLLARNPKLEIRDISYVALHVMLLLLSLAFSGELLFDYHIRGTVGRVEIVTLFALAGSFFQVTLLHLLPNVIRLIVLSSLNWNTFSTLLLENVGKSSIIVFAVFVLEILLLWVNFGTTLFSHVYKWNGFWLWGFVAMLAVLHIVSFENYQSAVSLRGSHSSRINVTGIEEGTELISLESGTCSTPTSLQSVDLDSQVLRSSDDRTVPVTYGSTYSRPNAAFSPEISATFISSWSSEVTRLFVLVDFLLASWAIWVARHNVSIIFRLSPLSAGIVWGFFPMWVLGVVLLLLLATLLFSFCMWKRRKYIEKVSGFVDARTDTLHSRRDVSTTPLMG